MSVKPEDIACVDIYPPINVARVGDSSEHFIGSEVPGVEPTPDGGFKDKDHKIKKQAARFRVYAFDKDSKPLGEITNDGYSLSWKVHVANKKAAWITHRSRFKFVKEVGRDDLRNPDVQGLPEGQKKPYEYTNTRTELIIDPGEKVVEGANVKDVFLDGQFGNDKEIPLHKDVRLGELRTDEKGRLLVLASDGKSFPASGNPDEMLQNGFDNAGWVDKVCDGTVRVTVKSKSQPE
ncbi:unnamed protein product [Rhizoctonia solani]|nr:unnamed protein product [Rhizoctonia solani]